LSFIYSCIWLGHWRRGLRPHLAPPRGLGTRRPGAGRCAPLTRSPVEGAGFEPSSPRRASPTYLRPPTRLGRAQWARLGGHARWTRPLGDTGAQRSEAKPVAPSPYPLVGGKKPAARGRAGSEPAAPRAAARRGWPGSRRLSPQGSRGYVSPRWRDRSGPYCGVGGRGGLGSRVAALRPRSCVGWREWR